jgi:hypothetical protein
VADLLITNDNKPDVQVLVEELRQLQRWVAAPMVEQKGNGVGEAFAQQPACQMPEAARPRPLYGVTSYQQRKDGLYPVAKAAQISAPYGVGISFRKRSAPPVLGPGRGLAKLPATRYNRGMLETLVPCALELWATTPAPDHPPLLPTQQESTTATCRSACHPYAPGE